VLTNTGRVEVSTPACSHHRQAGSTVWPLPKAGWTPVQPAGQTDKNSVRTDDPDMHGSDPRDHANVIHPIRRISRTDRDQRW
jgi:hypothetical protein